MSIVTENQQRPTHTGSGIIFIIVAIAALASLAVGMSTMSRISTVNQLQFNQANSARNLALSGIEYAKGVAYAYAHLETPKTLPEVTKYLSDNPTYNLGDPIGSFTLTDITTGTNSFSVKAIGSTPSGGNLAKYKTESSTSIPYSSGDTPIDKSSYAMNNKTGNTTLNGKNIITGSIYAKKDVSLNGKAVVDGNVMAGGCVTINQGTVTGNVCTTCSSASWSSTTEVDGNVIVFGDLTMNGGTYGGDVYVTGKLTTNSSATINGNIYAGSIYINSINLLGNAYATGDIYNGTGSKYHPHSKITFPDSCEKPTITPKDATISYASDPLLIQSEKSYTFSAAGNNDLTYNSIDFTQITLNNKNKILYFDLSKGDINILATGDVAFNQPFTILVSPTGAPPWEIYDPSDVSSTMKAYAKRIYLESHGTVSLCQKANWLGTIYAHGYNLNGDNNILGTVYSSSDNTNANSGVNITIMPSNFVDKWWTK
jgi:cytoskeletal protein CcmA (bactofilin family)